MLAKIQAAGHDCDRCRDLALRLLVSTDRPRLAALLRDYYDAHLGDDHA